MTNKQIMDRDFRRRQKAKAKLPDKLFATSERDIEKACTQLIGYDGWRSLCTDPPQLRGLGVLEPGIPDRLYIRYQWGDIDGAAHGYAQQDAEVLWIEWKKVGGKAQQNQKDWHALERSRGALVWLAGVDFPATYDGFKAHYRASGLNRGKV